MRNFVFAFISIVSIEAVVAQKIDSLKSLLPKKIGLERCDVLRELAHEYIDIDNLVALQYGEKAFDAAYLQGDSLRIVKAGRISALTLRRLGKLDSSLSISFRVIPIAERNNFVEELKMLFNGIGLAYTNMAEYDKALKYDLRSLELGQGFGTENEIISLHNIGFIFYRLKDYDKALSYFDRAVKLKYDLDNIKDLDLMLMNVSLCYAQKKNFGKSREVLKEAQTKCSGPCSETFLTCAEYNFGIISLGENKVSDAESHFMKSYLKAVSNNDQRFQLENIISLVRIFMMTNRLHLAEGYLSKAETLVSLGTPYKMELVKIYNEFVRLFEKSSNFEKIANYQRKYIQLKDSTYSEELTINLMRIEAEFIERENISRLDSQNKILHLNERVISRQRFVNLFVGIIALLLIVLALILFVNYKRSKRINWLLEQRVKERTIELETNRNIVEKSLEEQDLYARKLSSDLKQGLATIKGLCSLGLKDEDHSVVVEYLNKINETSEQLLKVIKRHSTGQ